MVLMFHCNQERKATTHLFHCGNSCEAKTPRNVLCWSLATDKDMLTVELAKCP